MQQAASRHPTNNFSCVNPSIFTSGMQQTLLRAFDSGYPLRDTPAITELAFPLSATFQVIQEHDFGDFQAVTSICIPASVELLCSYAFISLKSLQDGRDLPCLRNVTFAPGSKLRTINPRAFEGCYELESICLPVSVTNVTAESFLGCGLREVSVESGHPFCG
jgi:hypothetical protein